MGDDGKIASAETFEFQINMTNAKAPLPENEHKRAAPNINAETGATFTIKRNYPAH